MSAGGSAARAVATNVALSRMSAENNSGSSRPRTSTTSSTPPATGTLRSILKVDSAMNWITVTCQFAAATSAPRFNTVLTSTAASIPAPIYSTLRGRPPMVALVRPARRGYAADNRARDASTPDVAAPGLVPHGLRPRLAGGPGVRVPHARTDRRRGPPAHRRRREAGVHASRRARSTGPAAAASERPDLMLRASSDLAAARELFTALASLDGSQVAVTVYGSDGSPLAWSGRPSELPGRQDSPAPPPCSWRPARRDCGSSWCGRSTPPKAHRLGTSARLSRKSPSRPAGLATALEPRR